MDFRPQRFWASLIRKPVWFVDQRDKARIFDICPFSTIIQTSLLLFGGREDGKWYKNSQKLA